MQRLTHGICSCLMLSLVLMPVTGCVQVPTTVGQTSNVTMTSDGEQAHIANELTAEDFIKLAGTVTEKMLSSQEVQAWTTKKSKPLLVVAVPENTTHRADIIAEDIQDEVIQKILESQVCRVIDESSVSSDYDYIIKSTITSTNQRGDNGSQLTYYTLKFQLFSMRGERIGQYHDKIGMMKAARSAF